MIINDDRHDFICTDCRHTGRPCMEALWLCQQLIRSACTRNEPTPDRDITGAVQFKGCGFACNATVQVSRGDVQILCGIEYGAAPSPGRLPRAMVLAEPVPRARVEEQVRRRA